MKVQYQSGECSYSSLMFHCVLDKERVIPKYFYYYLYYNMDILNEYVIGVQPKFSYDSFLSRKITMPTLEVQEDIIRRIGIIESQLTALENLGKQAEDNARFILESYLGATAPMPTAQSSDAHSSTCKVDEGGVGCTCRATQTRDDACDDACDDAPMIARDDAPMIAAQAAGALGRAD